VKVILGLDLLIMALLYGYSLAAQPRYATPGARRVAAWTHRQPFLGRCVVAFVVWLMFMTGIYFFSQGTSHSW
jgi:hypothetical protein